MSFWQNYKNRKFIRENQSILTKVKGSSLIHLSDNELNSLFFSFKNTPFAMEDALASICEIIKRKTGIQLHDNQILSALVIANGKIAEMATGEGKTLSAISAAMILYLSNRKVHIFTANDYLVERDYQYAKNILSDLNITIGFIHQGVKLAEKKSIYDNDIIYMTSKEGCFDFLNQQFIKEKDELFNVSRDFAIIDEVDYVLIEEARSPIALSSKKDEDISKYVFINDLKYSFTIDEDFSIDFKANKIDLTDDGYLKIEFLSKKYDLIGEKESIYDDKNLYIIKLFGNALRAEYILKKNHHYLVQEGAVIIVDENSGRVFYGRRWNDGLHQAVEAKENVNILPETNTIARTTLQHFFKKYKNISGMTGTAITEAIEFKEIYNLDVIQIESNKPLLRHDLNDIVFQDKKSSIENLITYVKEEHLKGRPVLVGTLSVTDSEIVHNILVEQGFSATILNAKNHKNESTIIQNAGMKGNITISTNMAGRGTDIMLGGYKKEVIDNLLDSGLNFMDAEKHWQTLHDEVEALGGLAIVGLARSHSRRLDNQLIGRSGRQGDNGSSIFFISLEDDLIKGFGAEVHLYVRTIGLRLPGIGVSDNKVSKDILHAQKRNENEFFNLRKDVIRYSHLVEEQNEIISDIRKSILDTSSLNDYNYFIKNVFSKIVTDLDQDVHSEEDLFIIKNEMPENIEQAISSIFKVQEIDMLSLLENNVSSYQQEDFKLSLYGDLLYNRYLNKQKMFIQYLEGANVELVSIYKRIALMVIDGIWCDHLENLDNIKKQSQFSNFSKNNPVQVFGEEADDAFSKTLRQIFLDIGYSLYEFKPEDLNIKSNNT